MNVSTGRGHDREFVNEQVRARGLPYPEDAHQAFRWQKPRHDLELTVAHPLVSLLHTLLASPEQMLFPWQTEHIFAGILNRRVDLPFATVPFERAAEADGKQQRRSAAPERARGWCILCEEKQETKGSSGRGVAAASKKGGAVH